MKKRFRMPLFSLLVALVAAAWITAVAADRQTRETMEAKLLHSKALFEGIVTEDFQKVAENAGKLHALSQSADWRLRQTPEYQRYTREFARQAKAIENAAAARNLDGATLGYLQMTMTCVNCHRHMRGSEQAAVTEPESSDPALAGRFASVHPK